MTHMIINSEGDMEKGIEEATKLAVIDSSSLTLEFPTENFAKEYNYAELNALQQLHIDGLVDLYAPRRAEACKYKHNADEKGQFISAEYIEGSERMVDLPSHVDQWKDDYKRRFRNGKSTRNR